MTHHVLLMSFFFAFAASACTDDTALTIKAQSRVNQALGTDSTVEVRVHDGVATLSGLASTETSRERAESAARAVDGVREIKDEIAVPRVTQTTGATVPAPLAP
jgi:osmotically-inducible protein OsmY